RSSSSYNSTDITLSFDVVSFFFQAEDGIRDRNVTGVQTCALPISEGDSSAVDEADAERASLREDVEAMEVKTMLSGEYDQREAVVNIRAGAGGVDAADFAEMLMRMYIRWAEKAGHKVEVYDTSYAEEAGIKSATFVVRD